jgi:hypothetical protein
MRYYLVQGKETDDSADDSFTYHYVSIDKDFTLKELETLALDQYCNDRDIDRAKDGKYYWESDDMTEMTEVVIDIWDIFQSDSPITLFTQTNKEQN